MFTNLEFFNLMTTDCANDTEFHNRWIGKKDWSPACAGMTEDRPFRINIRFIRCHSFFSCLHKLPPTRILGGSVGLDFLQLCQRTGQCFLVGGWRTEVGGFQTSNLSRFLMLLFWSAIGISGQGRQHRSDSGEFWPVPYPTSFFGRFLLNALKVLR